MLARVAANIYWMGRYLERAESMARLVGATRAMVLDLTGSREDHTRHWQHLLTITGNDDLFMTHGGHMDETGVIYFLISQDDHPGSLRSAVAMARENMRTLRDLFPREFWRHLNQLHRFLGEDPATLCNPDALPEALDEVIRHCHTLVGILLSTTSRDMVFDLLRLGQHIERADMTTRLLDLDPAHMGPEAGDTPWLHLLRSISAEPMYRRHVQPRIHGPAVFDYLLRDRLFPRSLNYCLHELERCLGHFDQHAMCMLLIKRMERTLDDVEITHLLTDGPGTFMDGMQRDLGNLHHHIAAIYFAIPAPAPG